MNGYRKNKGSTVVEATIIIPLFLFCMVTFFHMCQAKIAQAYLTEASYQTAEYIAEYSFVGDGNIVLAKLKEKGYVDNKKAVDKYLKNINYIGSKFLDGDYVLLRTNYKVKVPFIASLTKNKSFTIRQRAYIGAFSDANKKQEITDDDKWVYITDNKEVYHLSRTCSHLVLSMSSTSIDNAKAGGYTPCEYCGSKCSNQVIITDSGNKYHSSTCCSGLKRTVKRVKLSEVGGIGACSRCGE